MRTFHSQNSITIFQIKIYFKEGEFQNQKPDHLIGIFGTSNISFDTSTII